MTARETQQITRAIGDVTAGYTGVMISLGSKLGLYRGRYQMRSSRFLRILRPPIFMNLFGT